MRAVWMMNVAHAMIRPLNNNCDKTWMLINAVMAAFLKCLSSISNDHTGTKRLLSASTILDTIFSITSNRTRAVLI